MAGCCPSRDYHRFFNQRFARRLANRYLERGLDQTAQRMVEFPQGGSGRPASCTAGASARSRSSCGLERGPRPEPGALHAYEQQARTLAAKEGVQGRLDWRLHDLAQTPEGWRRPTWWSCTGVCCYPDYARLLARPPTMPGAPWSSAIHPATRSPGLLRTVQPGDAADPALSGLRPPEGAMLAVLEDRGLADLPGSEPNLAGRWPGARFVGAALACVSCGHG